MPSKKELGRRLRLARFRRGFTLKDVARRCGMSATHISEVERTFKRHEDDIKYISCRITGHDNAGKSTG